MTNERRRSRRKLWTSLGVVVLVIVVVALFWIWRHSAGSQSTDEKTTTYTVGRQDLIINVTEGGSIRARNSEDIRSKVEGRTTIISIVPEGTVITKEDVENGKVLVELDSSDLRRRLTEREINVASAESDDTEAKEAYDIQKKENESELNKAHLEVKFALMDVQQFLGETLAAKVIPASEPPQDPNSETPQDPNTDLATLVIDDRLGGQALQKVRELDAAITLQSEELQQARNSLYWTRRLFENEYASQADVESGEFKEKRLQIELAKAQLSKDLYERYEFLKEVEKRLSDYREAKLKLERTEATCRSKLAQAKARKESSEARYNLQQEELKKIQDQLNACTIRAPKEGMVVYGSSTEFRPWDRPIEEGSDVREREKIITIPDMSEMTVEIQVHESWVDRIEPNLPAKVTLDAFPDDKLAARVLKVAPLASPQAFWLDTGLKVYKTEIVIEDHHESLKPGMSANVEVLIGELKDVLCVPVQAVADKEGQKYCYVTSGGATEFRQVKTGQFNDSFIEIVEGLNEGEKVSLVPPKESLPEINKDKEEEKSAVADQETTDQPPAVTGAPKGQPAKTETKAAHQSGSAEGT